MYRVGGGVAIFVNSISGLILKYKSIATITEMSVKGVFECYRVLVPNLL